MYHLTSITSQGPSLNIWEILYKNNKKTLNISQAPNSERKAAQWHVEILPHHARRHLCQTSVKSLELNS